MELTKRCLDCKIEKPLEAFRLCYIGKPSTNPEYGLRNPSAVRQNRCKACYARRERAQLKLDFLAAYGGKCACCGEDDPRFLSLDHVKDDGNEHRKTTTCQQIYRIARNEGYPRDRYQPLCFNCNMGKSTNGGVCPHKSGLTKEEAIEELRSRNTFIGRKHVDPKKNGSRKTLFTGGFDARRMQLSRRVLKPCPFCQKEFGSNEMVRHKQAEHAEEMKAQRLQILAAGRKQNVNGQGLEREVH